ncbi:MAG: tetratricopeptide repeat protein [Burkholderiales bacterium]|nr:tetratricopeptide repeat protein [Burkholderiales bacterium]
MALHTYLPQDRLRALAQGASLPERTQGSALFADITGFTRLTEELTHRLGARRGIEALSQRVGAAYEALIQEVERHGGSVIGFAGDSITCWFDAGANADAADLANSARRAARAAMAMQAAMRQGGELSVKLALASGPARRFAVGDAALQRLDVLAGATLARMARLEQQAQPGEVVLDAATAALLGLGAVASVGEGEPTLRLTSHTWPDAGSALSKGTGEQALAPSAAPPPIERVLPWVLPFVQEREADGGLFATDLRPAAVLFVRFGGLDYDGDETAAAQLDALITRAQHLLHAYEGQLLELTVGDKGSYFLASFGADRVREDDAFRAVCAALALRDAGFELPMQFGLSHGLLRVGAYGSSTRRSFGAMGDDTNAAARLMQIAQPGEILISARLRTQLAQGFQLEARPPLPLKGKGEPMLVFAVMGKLRQRAIRLQEPAYGLPMVGREPQQACIEHALREAAAGRGQVIVVEAEAGMGKSRLLAEGIRQARRAGFQGYGGSCVGDGLNEPYHLWHGLLQALFDIDPQLPRRRCIRQLRLELAEHAPEHEEAWPLLGAGLGMTLPENEFTEGLQAKDRKALLESMLLRCLAGEAREAAVEGGGLLLVLEDLHAIDASSLDLLRQLCAAAVDLPMLMLLSQRPESGSDRLEPVPHLQTLALAPLDAAQAEQVIRATLAHLYPERVGGVAAGLIEQVAQRAQGNPFYIEELLGYLHDRGLDLRRLGAEAPLEWPTSLHALVLSRIDQLPRTQQQVLKVASIVGRVFLADELPAFYPLLGSTEAVRGELQVLDRLGFTPQELEAEQLTYLFRHRVTLEVGYESMPYATRVYLHGLYAQHLEARCCAQSDGQDALRTQAAALAHHFSRAEQPDKAWPHLLQAGKQAAARFANDEALALFARALAAMPSGERLARFELLLKQEEVFDLLGEHARQRDTLTELAALASELNDAPRQAEVHVRLAKLEIDLGHYPAAEAASAKAIAGAAAAVGAERQQADGLLLLARARFHAGATAAARAPLDKALALARQHGHSRGEYNILALLGLLHWQQGEHAQAEALLTDALARTRGAGDARRELDLLNNLGVVAKSRGDFAQAIAYYEQAGQQARRIGDRAGEALLVNNIGSACLAAGEFERALRESKAAAGLFERLDEPAAHGMALLNWAEALRELGQVAAARPLAEQALAGLRSCGHKRGEACVCENLGLLARSLGELDAALHHFRDSLAMAEEVGLPALKVSVTLHWADTLIDAGRLNDAASLLASLTAPAEAPVQDLMRRVVQCRLDLARAQQPAHVDELMAGLLAASPQALPLSLYASALQVLQQVPTADRAAMQRLLDLARAELQARCERMGQADLRQSFLELPAHRWLQKGLA